MGEAASGYLEEFASINGNANALVELAGALRAARINLDTGTLARVPHSHPDVAAEVTAFTSAIDDRGTDAVLMFAALASRLRDSAHAYAAADAQSQQQFDALLTSGVFHPGAALP